MYDVGFCLIYWHGIVPRDRSGLDVSLESPYVLGCTSTNRTEPLAVWAAEAASFNSSAALRAKTTCQTVTASPTPVTTSPPKPIQLSYW